MTIMYGELNEHRLHKIWELTSIEHLSGIGRIGAIMRRLDMTSETHLIFEGGGHSETFLYKIVDHKIQLFEKDGNHTEEECFWSIENATVHELCLVLIVKEDNEKLVRLKYRAEG